MPHKKSSASGLFNIKALLNPRVRDLPISATFEVNERCKQLTKEGRDIIRFGLGQSPFPVPKNVAETLASHAHEKDYTDVQGLPALREAVAQFHRTHDGFYACSERILIGPGSKSLIFLLEFVLSCELVLPSPAWVSYAPQAKMVGNHVLHLPAYQNDGYKLSADVLDFELSQLSKETRLLILNYPGNPTGVTFKDAELRALAQIARKHRLIVLSDEIYGHLHHGNNHTSIAKYYPEGTIVSSGLSKWCGAGGWRIGTFAFPEELEGVMHAMIACSSESHSSVNTPAQYAAIEAFSYGEAIKTYVTRCRKIVSLLGHTCADMLRSGGVEVAEPGGGFYLFPNFQPHRDKLKERGITTDIQLCRYLLNDTGVAILPGSVFGCSPQDLTARIAYVDFDGKALLDALENGEVCTHTLLQKYCSRVYDGMNRITAWLK